MSKDTLDAMMNAVIALDRLIDEAALTRRQREEFQETMKELRDNHFRVEAELLKARASRS